MSEKNTSDPSSGSPRPLPGASDAPREQPPEVLRPATPGSQLSASEVRVIPDHSAVAEPAPLATDSFPSDPSAVPKPPPEFELAPLSAAVTERTTVSPSLRLEYKHPLAIRWMHWINFPVLFTMIWSGMLIYWNDSDNAYKHPHAVYRIGLGSFTLVRFFPDWFWKAFDVPYHVTEGLGYHFFFMWIFALNGIAYVLYTVISGEWRFIVPEPRSFRDAIQVTLSDLHLRKGLPPQKKYNGAQRIAYTAVIFMGLGSLVTGLAIYKPTQAHWFTTALGGYEMARWEHFWLTLGFCGFFVIHVLQVVLAGWNNFRSMISGREIKRIAEPSLEAERRTW